MLDQTAVERLADIVDAAQSDGHTIAKLTDDHPGMTVDDGYAVQDACLRRWRERGRVLVGYKAGLTSRAKMVQMGVSVPSFGLLMRDTCDAEGGFVPTKGLIHPRVEAEIDYVTKSDLSGAGLTIEQVHAATDFIQPAIEILDSRFEKFKFDLPSVVADNGSSARFVLGGRPRRPDDVDPATIGIVLEINGDAVALACSGAVLGHPARAICMLVEWLHSRGQILPAGSVVLTGAATEAMPIAKGDAICARFQDMGSINVRVD